MYAVINNRVVKSLIKILEPSVWLYFRNVPSDSHESSIEALDGRHRRFIDLKLKDITEGDDVDG
jgi:hypothetical protein